MLDVGRVQQHHALLAASRQAVQDVVDQIGLRVDDGDARLGRDVAKNRVLQQHRLADAGRAVDQTAAGLRLGSGRISYGY